MANNRLNSNDIRKLLDSLPGMNTTTYFDAVGRRNVPVIRFNPLKHDFDFQKELLIQQGFQLEEFEGIPGYRIIFQPYSIGKSLSHFIGHIYIQNPSSMLPAVVLDPKPGDQVLDICAAPGSKTTQMAAMMKNQGILAATDISKKRINGLAFNLRRMGTVNTVVMKCFGEQAGNRYFEHFDKVLLDPPCSALGTIHKSPEVLSWWTPSRSEKLQRVQIGLLHSALKALRPGGTLVYSTCTITPQENEEVVDYALREFPVELQSIQTRGLKVRPGLIKYGSRKFSPEMEKAIRIYPSDNHSEGFFIALIRKTDSFSYQRFRHPVLKTQMALESSSQGPRKTLNFLSDRFEIPMHVFGDYLYREGGNLNAVCRDISNFPLYDEPAAIGLPIAHIRSVDPKLTTEGCHLLGHYAKKNTMRFIQLEEIARFVNREDIPCDKEPKHQVLVGLEEWILGHGIIDRGFLLSRFPRTGWQFSLNTTH